MACNTTSSVRAWLRNVSSWILLDWSFERKTNQPLFWALCYIIKRSSAGDWLFLLAALHSLSLSPLWKRTKCGLRQSKISKPFPGGGACPRTPLQLCIFTAHRHPLTKNPATRLDSAFCMALRSLKFVVLSSRMYSLLHSKHHATLCALEKTLYGVATSSSILFRTMRARIFSAVEGRDIPQMVATYRIVSLTFVKVYYGEVLLILLVRTFYKASWASCTCMFHHAWVSRRVYQQHQETSLKRSVW